VGFILVHKDSIATELLKTTDGGRSWESLGVILDNHYAKDPFFWDGQTGIVPVYKNPPYPSLLKTEDGGQSWEEIILPGLVGALSDLCTDGMGNIYGRTSGFDVPNHIIKSTDRGASWEKLYTLPSWQGRILEVENERIYVEQPGHELLVLDLEGNEVGRIQMDHITNLIDDFKVVDHNNIIATDTRNAIKTSDGGQNWALFFEGEVKLIDFTSPDEGLMVLQKGFCEDDILASYSISHTVDGGHSWTESNWVYGLDPWSTTLATLSTSRYVLLVKNGPDRYDMYELKAEG